MQDLCWQQCPNAGMAEQIVLTEQADHRRSVFGKTIYWHAVCGTWGHRSCGTPLVYGKDDEMSRLKDPSCNTPKAKRSGSPMDVQCALERAMGDLTFLEMMLQQFLDQMPEQLEKIKAALEQGDHETVQEKAHSLKGSASHLSAENVAAMALQLEEMGRAGDIEKGKAAFDLLKDEIDRLSAYLAQSKGYKPF